VYPQTLLHSPNGRFVAVCGDGEYIIYTALAWRNKSFGSALDFVWASKENSNDFAIRESATSVKVYKNFTENSGGLDVGFQAEGLTGGVLLGVKGQGGVSFFDWATGALVRRIEVEPRQVGNVQSLLASISSNARHRSTGLRAASSLPLPAKTPSTS
jgi:coatomer subunit beta'